MSTTDGQKPRDRAIDLLKFVAIYLVILGHCLGRFGLGMEVLDHPLGKLIVMVNMPLFIFVTGFFGQSLYSRTLRELLLGKYKSLIRPTLVYSLLTIVICDIILRPIHFSLVGGANLFVERCVNGYWFVWVVIYCSFYSWLFVKLGEKLRIHRGVILLISLALLLLIPDTPYIPCISSFKAMYPLFLLGMLFREKNWLDWTYSHKRVILPLTLVGYLIAFFFYKGVWSFYYFPLTPFPRVIYYYALMIVIGVIGIVLLYVTFRGVWERYKGMSLISKLAELGSYSLAIYLIQGIFVEVADCYKEQLTINNHSLLTIIAIVVSIVLTTFISLLVLQFKRNQWLSAYLLGK